MTELTLSTPSILFSAISLILLAYTNRFLSYAQVVRNLKADHDKIRRPSRACSWPTCAGGFTWPGKCSFSA